MCHYSTLYITDSVKAGNQDPLKDSQINHLIGCWFRMKITLNKNDADISTNTETPSRETGSTSVEANTIRSSPIPNAPDHRVAGSSSRHE